MKIQLWSAFASNNSGSYTIVGSFPDAARAAAVADELRALIAAHQAWFEAQPDAWSTEGTSPLDVFCAAEGIAVDQPPGRADDWPQYGPPPTVAAVGSQVVVYVAYTASMTSVFGASFFRRKGRVDVELVHSHEPLVWIHEVWWPWEKRDAAKVAAARLALLDAAFADDGPLVVGVHPMRSPSWRSAGHFIEADLTVAVVWQDPVVGATAFDALVRAHGASMRSRVIEAYRDEDPAGLFRPSSPAVPRGLFDVVLREVRGDRAAATRALSGYLFHTQGDHASVVALLGKARAVVARAKPQRVAEDIAAALEEAGCAALILPHADA